MNAPSFVTDFFAHLHSHFREIALQRYYLEKALVGGADIVGGMPNTEKPLTTPESVNEYWLAARLAITELTGPGTKHEGRKLGFVPFAYLNEKTTYEMMVAFIDMGVYHFKLYPRYRTTNSDDGVVNYYPIIDVVRRAAEYAMDRYGKKIYVHFHPEHPCLDFPGRIAEYVFLPIVEMFLTNTRATIVWEHGTDGDCILVWKKFAQSERFFVTITAHHLVANEDTTHGMVNAVCKPPFRTEPDRMALLGLIGEDHPWVLLGPDDAPHDFRKKQPEDGSNCACGAYTAFFLPELCAHALEDILKKGVNGERVFRNFTSRNAREAFMLPHSTGQMTLVRKEYRIPMRVAIGDNTVVIPFWANRSLRWSRE